MPRAIWSGSISFGLVNIPVKLYTAVRQKDVRFHQLEKSTNARVKNKRVSGETGEEVAYEDIVKGYELSPDRYVVIDPDELESLAPEATRLVDIEDFVDLDQIDPIYFDHTYYLVPDKGGSKAYRLLIDAMRETNKVAIGKVVLRTKQYLAAIRPISDDALALNTMLFADEVVPTEELDELPEGVEASERELKMARQLIDSLTTDFDPDKYRDEYRERVLELIEKKAEGQEIVVQPMAEEPAKVVDLMAALEASLAEAKSRRKTG
jgi:DNA end-binding protein Ku